MDTLSKAQAKVKQSSRDIKADVRSAKSHIREAAGELLNEGKKLADELYHEGLHKVTDAEEGMKEYTDELLKKAKQNPLTSLLIAAGVGFILSSLIRK